MVENILLTHYIFLEPGKNLFFSMIAKKKEKKMLFAKLTLVSDEQRVSVHSSGCVGEGILSQSA